MRRALALVSLVVVAAGCGPEAAPEPTTAEPGWERLPDGPLSGRVGATVVALDDRHVLVVGGLPWLCPPTADCAGPSDQPFHDGAVVDLGTGEWRRVADAPYPFAHARAVALDGAVYLLTQREPFTGPSDLLRYDPGSDRWDRLASPQGRCGVLVPAQEVVFALCGTEESEERRDRLYDPASDTWETLPDDPLPRTYDRFGVVDDDRLLVFGSVTHDSTGKVVAALDLGTGEWTRLPDAPGRGYQAWDVGDEVYLNAHFSPGGGGVLELGSDSWSAPPGPPEDPDWNGDAAGVLGVDGATYEYADGWVRDTVRDRWVEVPERGGSTYDESVAAAGDALVVFGGQDWGPGAGGDEGRLVDDLWVWRPPA